MCVNRRWEFLPWEFQLNHQTRLGEGLGRIRVLIFIQNEKILNFTQMTVTETHSTWMTWCYQARIMIYCFWQYNCLVLRKVSVNRGWAPSKQSAFVTFFRYHAMLIIKLIDIKINSSSLLDRIFTLRLEMCKQGGGTVKRFNRWQWSSVLLIFHDLTDWFKVDRNRAKTVCLFTKNFKNKTKY